MEESIYHNNNKSKVGGWSSPTVGSVLSCLFIGALSFTLIWILIAQNNHASSMHTIVSEYTMRYQQQRGNGRVVTASIGGADGQPKIIRMCTKEFYYTESGEWNDTLTKLNMTIDDIVSPAMINSYFYSISVSVDIEFNTDISEVISLANSPAVKLNPTMRFMSFSYNITTNYPYFSRINLVELEFDTPEESVKQPRTIPICSNLHENEMKHCNRRGDDKIVTIHNKNWRPLSGNIQRRPEIEISKPSETLTTTRRPITNNGKNGNTGGSDGVIGDEDVYDMIQSNENDILSYTDAQKEEINRLRLYNIVFYKKNLGRQFITHNFNTRNGGSNGPEREEKILTLELHQC
jgi:hypothetical protein